MKTIPARMVKIGDKINRFGHLHPVLSVTTVNHPIVKVGVIEVTHDLGRVCFMPDAKIEIAL